MNKNTKKIIAREGLILGLFVLPLVFILLISLVAFEWGGRDHYPRIMAILGVSFVYLAVIGYPLCSAIRFIIWAIKTIKDK